MKSIPSVILVTSLISCLPALAEDIGVFSKGLSGDTAYDKIWSAPILYKNEDNQYIQEFSLQGRLQLQSIFGEAGGDSYNTSDYKDQSAANDERVWGNDIEVRRAYLGFKTKLFQNWKLEGQIDVDTDGHDEEGDSSIYGDIYDLYAIYAPSDAMNIGIGKQEIKFSREQEISSKEIVTFERSLTTNLLHAGNLTGIWVNGKGIEEHWLYEAGLYGADQQREFSSLDRGALFIGKVGHDYSSQAGLDSSIVSFRYEHNTNPGYQSSKVAGFFGNPTSPAFTDAIALSNDIVQGRFGLTTDLLFGFGLSGTADRNGNEVAVNQSDIFGLNIIPSYFIAEGLQLVSRLQIATSTDPNGLRVPGRYERLAAGDDESGNTYVSGYLGVNYYLYGNKLKIMNGIEYSQMGGGNFDGYTAMTGLRMSF